MGNVTIFESQSALPVVRRQSRLADKMGTGGGSLRRIQTATNGTFRRIVGGEKIGKSATGAIDVIIVDMLSDVSRQFYAAKYDPDAPPTLPDCWSNMGVKPEAAASNKQATACNSCPKNVEGSGTNGKGRACRFLRRLAVLIVGDPSGEVYQLNVPAASLFGKGIGNIHPFESYKNFLRANGEAADTVVTRVMYDSEADTMKLKFQPIRQLTAEEDALVTAAQEDPETERYTKLTAAEADGVTKTPTTPAPAAAPAPKASGFFSDAEDEDEVPVQVKEPEPKKRASKKAEAPATQAKPELDSVLSSWLDDDADGDDA